MSSSPEEQAYAQQSASDAFAAPPERAVAPQTGEEQVDSALGELATVSELPLAAHAERFDRVHVALQGMLTGLDEG